jgi:predicted RNA methylase
VKAARANSDEDFPYWDRTLPAFDVMFNNLKAQAIDPEVNDKKTTINCLYPEDHRTKDGVSNLFTERVRIRGSFQGLNTPLENYRKYNTDNREYKTGTYEYRREAVYSLGPECNAFNPTFAMFIYRALGARGSRIVDLSTGWLDRAIAAAAIDAAVYHGVDPNPSLVEPGKRMVKACADVGCKTQFQLICARGETRNPLWVDNSYDVCLLSPPFYSLEEYVKKGDPGHGDQSIARCSGYSKWVRDFLEPYYANACKLVRPGGFVVTYVENVRLSKARANGQHQTINLAVNTSEIMVRQGMVESRLFGLRVKAASSLKAAKVRWATVWVKPLGIPASITMYKNYRYSSCPVSYPVDAERVGGGILVVRDDRLPYGFKTRGTTVLPSNHMRTGMQVDPTTTDGALVRYLDPVRNCRLHSAPGTGPPLHYINTPSYIQAVSKLGVMHAEPAASLEYITPGFNDVVFVDTLAAKVAKNTPEELRGFAGKRIFVARTTGASSVALSLAFPDAVVQGVDAHLNYPPVACPWDLAPGDRRAWDAAHYSIDVCEVQMSDVVVWLTSPHCHVY